MQMYAYQVFQQIREYSYDSTVFHSHCVHFLIATNLPRYPQLKKVHDVACGQIWGHTGRNLHHHNRTQHCAYIVVVPSFIVFRLQSNFSDRKPMLLTRRRNTDQQRTTNLEANLDFTGSPLNSPSHPTSRSSARQGPQLVNMAGCQSMTSPAGAPGQLGPAHILLQHQQSETMQL